MQRKDDLAAVAQLSANNPMSTKDILIMFAKMRLKNGKDLWNTNPILREFVALDMQLTTLMTRIVNDTPNVRINIERGENIFNACTKVTDASVKPMLESLNKEFQQARQQGLIYLENRQETHKKIKNAASELLTTVESMIDQSEATKGNAKYRDALNKFSELRKQLKSFESDVNQLQTAGNRIHNEIISPAKRAVSTLVSIPETKRPGTRPQELEQSLDEETPKLED